MQVVHLTPHKPQIERTYVAPNAVGHNHEKTIGATPKKYAIIDPVDLSPEAQKILAEGKPAAINPALGGSPTRADLVALLDIDEEIVEIVEAAREETPLDEMTQAP